MLDIISLGIVYYLYRDNKEMTSLKGGKNKNSDSRPSTSSLSSHERIRFIANLIIEKILEDQKNGQVLLKKIHEYR